MTDPDAPLMTSEALASFGRRALEHLEASRFYFDDDPEEAPPRGSHSVADAALSFFAAAAGALGDPSLLPLVAEVVEELCQFDQRGFQGFEPIGDGLAALLGAAASPEAVAHLTAHPHGRVRAAMARGLRADTPGGRALLEALVDDPSAGVRLPARASLAKVTEVAWWRGVFRSDPTAPSKAAASRASCEAVVAILNGDDEEPIERMTALRRCVAKLPDGPAREVGDTLFLAMSWEYAAMAPLFVDLMRRPGAPEYAAHLLVTLGDPASYYALEGVLVPAVKTLPEPERQRVCDALVDLLFARPRDEWKDSRSPSSIAAAAIVAGWTARGDVARLLDRLLAEPLPDGERYRPAFGKLTEVLTLDVADRAAILPRVIDAVERGCPAVWSALQGPCETLFKLAPLETRRAVATRQLHANDRNSVYCGMRDLLGSAHDPARDGPLAKRAVALSLDPRVRPAIFDGEYWFLCAYALPTWRAALRRGELSLREATLVMKAIDGLWGGFSELSAHAWRYGPRDLETERTETRARFDRTRARYRRFLGPKALRVPVTDEEWARWRSMRAAALATGSPIEDLCAMLDVLPPGAIEPDDRPFVEHVMRVWRETHDERICLWIPNTFTQHPDPWLLPMLEEFAAFGDTARRRNAHKALRAMRTHLGLAPVVAEAAAGGAPAAPRAADVDWMDRDD